MSTLAPISITASGDTTVIDNTAMLHNGAPVVLEILAVGLTTSADVNLTFKDGTQALTGAMPLRELLLARSDHPWFRVSAGSDFVINASASVTIGGWVEYRVAL